MAFLNPISPKVEEKLGYYVYLYIDPDDNSVFYVGKGKGSRMLAHLSDRSESRKVEQIRRIRARGQMPRIEILLHGLPDEATALKIEAAAIDLLGKNNLTNQVRGWDANVVGRMGLEQLAALYEARPVTIKEAVILIRINRLYRYGMSDLELYEATRGIWKMNPQRHRPTFAFAVYRGIVREVYCIENWHRAGSTPYQTRNDVHAKDRWEFVGQVAEERVHAKYIDMSVAAYLSANSQNPIRYVNC